MILQPLGQQPDSFVNGCFNFDIRRSYKGRLWIESGDSKLLLNNGMTFVLINGDTVRIPETYGCQPSGCPQDALSPCGA
jgi:hypothetical protein